MCEYEREDDLRVSWPDDETCLKNLTSEEKDAIIRSHFDCKMKEGCPCMEDREYECSEFKAFCKLTKSDGSEFDFLDCMFRTNEHRCLTDYILWKFHRGETC